MHYAPLQLNYENAKQDRNQREIPSIVGCQSSLDVAPKHRVAGGTKLVLIGAIWEVGMALLRLGYEQYAFQSK